MQDKEIKLEINGSEYAVIIHAFSAREAEVSVDGKKYTVGLKDLGRESVPDVSPQGLPARQAFVHKPKTGQKDKPMHRPKTLDDSGSIKAPLPGQIQKILIREGDSIRAGQPVMIIEAMKMENEVNASSAGIVVDIRHREGDSVNQGDTLVLLKPAE